MVLADFKETMHAAGSAFHHKAKGNGTAFQSVTLQLYQMACHKGRHIITNNDDLLSIVLYKNADKAIYQMLTVDFHQRLWNRYPFCCQP